MPPTQGKDVAVVWFVERQGDTGSTYKQVFKKILFGLSSSFVLALVLLLVYAFNWERISDDVAYGKLHRGQTRQDVERTIPDWTPRALHSDGGKPGTQDDFYARQHPGYRIVRYQWWLDIYVDVYYDGKNRVFLTNCCG